MPSPLSLFVESLIYCRCRENAARSRVHEQKVQGHFLLWARAPVNDLVFLIFIILYLTNPDRNDHCRPSSAGTAAGASVCETQVERIEDLWRQPKQPTFHGRSRAIHIECIQS